MNSENIQCNYIGSLLDFSEQKRSKPYQEMGNGYYKYLNHPNKNFLEKLTGNWPILTTETLDIRVSPGKNGRVQEFIKQKFDLYSNPGDQYFDQDLELHKYKDLQNFQSSLAQGYLQSSENIKSRNGQPAFGLHSQLIAEMSLDEGYFESPEISRTSDGQFSFAPSSTLSSEISLDPYQQPPPGIVERSPMGITGSDMSVACCCCCCGCCREPQESNLLSH